MSKFPVPGPTCSTSENPIDFVSILDGTSCQNELFWLHVGPFWLHFGPFGSHFGPFRLHFGPFLGHFAPFGL